MPQSLTVSNEPGAPNPTDQELQSLVAPTAELQGTRGDEEEAEDRQDSTEEDVRMQYFTLPAPDEGDHLISDYYRQFVEQIGSQLPEGTQKDHWLQQVIDSMSTAIRARHGVEEFEYEFEDEDEESEGYGEDEFDGI